MNMDKIRARARAKRREMRRLARRSPPAITPPTKGRALVLVVLLLGAPLSLLIALWSTS